MSSYLGSFELWLYLSFHVLEEPPETGKERGGGKLLITLIFLSLGHLGISKAKFC